MREYERYKEAERDGTIPKGSVTKYLRRYLIIFDDLGDSRDINRTIESQIVYARNYNISMIVCQQYYAQIVPKVRSNMNVLMFKKLGSDRDFDTMAKEILTKMNKHDLTEVVETLTENFGTFVFNKMKGKNQIEFIPAVK
jgi:hypothetical protein